MSRLDLAQSRFREALEVLENATGSVGESLDHAAKLPERIAELESEREKLLARIAELEDEVAVLSGLTEEVEGRPKAVLRQIQATHAHLFAQFGQDLRRGWEIGSTDTRSRHAPTP